MELRLLSILFILMSLPSFAGISVSRNVCNSYNGLLKSYGFTNHWQFLETSGTVAADSIGTNTGTYQNTPTLNGKGPLVQPSKMITLNGTSQYVSTTSLFSSPNTFTQLVWFKSNGGNGRLIGLGENQVGLSNNYDRHIYMTAVGQVQFGAFNGSVQVASSAIGNLNDNAWHMAVSTMSSSGMSLYIDGVLSGSNGNTAGQAFSGYWKVGFDNVTAWPNAANNYFGGQIAEAAIATGVAITAAQVRTLYGVATSCNGNLVPTPPPKVLSISPNPLNATNYSCNALTVNSNYFSTGAGTSVNLSGTGSGLTLYSDSNCTNTITSTTIPSGSRAVTVYVINTAAETSNLIATSSGYTSAMIAFTTSTNPYIWTGAGGNSNWTTAANWAGGAVPGSSNTAFFTNACGANCAATVNASISIGGLRMTSSYASTITQSSGFTITTNSGPWVQIAGTFAGGNSNVTTPSLILSGGTFSAPTATTAFTNLLHTGGTLTPGTGTFSNTGGGSISVLPAVSFNDFSFVGSSDVSIDSVLKVFGLLTLGKGANAVLGVGSIEASGNVALSGVGAPSYSSAGPILKMVGSSPQLITATGTSSTLPSIQFNSSSSVSLSGTIRVCSNYIYSSGTIIPGSSVLNFSTGNSNGTFTVTPGAFVYNEVAFVSNSSTTNLTGTFIVNGLLTLGNSFNGNRSINGGTLEARGNVKIHSYGIQGSTLLKIAGSGNQSIDATTATLASTPNVQVSSTGGTVSLAGTIAIGGYSYTYTSGTIAGGTSTLSLANGSYTFGTQNYGNVIFTQSNASVLSTLRVTGNTTLNSGVRVNFPNPGTSYALNTGGTLTLNTGSSLYLYGATNTYGSLSNSGTISP